MSCKGTENNGSGQEGMGGGRVGSNVNRTENAHDKSTVFVSAGLGSWGWMDSSETRCRALVKVHERSCGIPDVLGMLLPGRSWDREYE